MDSLEELLCTCISANRSGGGPTQSNLTPGSIAVIMLARIADRFVLRPTRHAIPVEDKTRQVIDYPGGSVEVWSQRTGDSSAGDAELFILKFPGTGGRAERATSHPADCWAQCRCEIWAINPPGYGGSPGRASVRGLAAAARAAHEQLERVAAGRPIFVTGTRRRGNLCGTH